MDHTAPPRPAGTRPSAGAAGDRPRAAPDVLRLVTDVLAHPDSLAVHLQPVVDLAHQQVVGHELLSRFGSTSPEPVFAAAEAAGLGAELDAVVLRRAVSLLAGLPPGTFLTVNASPERWTEPAWLDLVGELADPVTGLARLVVELTEHVPYTDVPAVQAGLGMLRDLGGLVALDDAGTGYSGLLQLASLRPDIVKVDRALVTDVDTDPVKAALVELLGSCAGRLDAWLLAEGVETAGELAALVRLGVPLAQGYALGRPAPEPAALAPALVTHLQGLAQRTQLAENLVAVTTQAVVVRPGEAVPDRLARTAVVVDGRGGPVALLVPVDGRPQRRPVSLRSQLSEPVAEVARRAMSRPVAQRFDPVVAVDAAGRLGGLAPVEDLLLHLARLSEA